MPSSTLVTAALVALALPVRSAAAQTCDQIIDALKPRPGQADTLAKILESNPNVNCAGSSGATPLFLAADASDAQSVTLLLARGADPNGQTGPPFRQNSVGTAEVRTPLMAAARHGNDAMIRQLLDAGARALTRSERGETAGDIAVSQKHEGARALLLRAEEGEYSPLAEHLMDERIALETLRRLALTAQRRRAEELQGDQGVARTGRGQASALLARIAASASGMLTGWRRQTEPRAVFAWSLTRSAKALEWAIHVRDLDLVRAVAEDLETKRRDCDARPERRFGAVKISIRTLADNVERQGLQVRFMEGFFFNLLPRRPDLASQWREFPRVSAIVDEPLPAGEYAIVAWAGGKPIGEPKSISVGINKSTRFDIVVP